MTVELPNGINDGIQRRLNSVNAFCITVPNSLPLSYLEVTTDRLTLTMWVCYRQILHPVGTG
jgi:hypothetical protein